MGNPIYKSAYNAAQIEAAIDKGPRINASGYWEVWNVSTMAYESTGVGAGVKPPTVVTQVSQMINHGYIYIYEGSEDGYTPGYFYFWNGSAWTAGGAYRVAATDKTLTVADAAADAKATGDAVGELKSAMDNNMPFELITGGTNGVSNGVHFEWSGKECHVYSDGASTGTAFNGVAGSNTTFPLLLEKGKTYRIKMDSASGNVGLQVYKWSSPSSESIITAVSDTVFTVPTGNYSGLQIRLRVGSGLTVDETVHPQILSMARTTEETIDLTNGRIAIETQRCCYPGASNQIEFEYAANNVINITLPRILAHYLDKDGKMKELVYNNNTQISVPHDSFAIFNYDTGLVEAKTLAQLKAMSGVNYCVLFYNSSGNVRGLFEKYAISDLISDQIDMYFYGRDNYPTFAFNNDNSIDVTIPANGRFNYLNKQYRKLWNGVSASNATSQTINVPHDHCLVFDRRTLQFTVVNYVLDYTPQISIMFYNSHGSVNGPWFRYYLEQKVLQSENDTKYPSYFNSQIAQKTKQANLQLAGSTEVDGFVFINDVHYNKNEMHSPLLVKDVCDKTGITAIHLNGDQITEEDNRETALLQINRVNSLYSFAGKETYLTVGNHEWNNPGALNTEAALAKQVSLAQMRFAFVNPMKKIVAEFASNSISYYYDNPISKVRYLVGCVTRGSTVITNSVKWIASKIEEAPTGYGIVIIIHTMLGFTKSGGVITPFIQNSDSAAFLADVADAVRSGSSVTFDGTTYNYQGKNLTMIAIFCGDTHADLFMRTNGGVPIVCTTTDSKGEDGNLTRTIGTVNEQAFDIVVIDREHEKIYCNRIGAGSDREINFA